MGKESLVLDLRRVRPIDAAIGAALIVAIGLAAFLGATVVVNRNKMIASTPAARAVEDLKDQVRKEPNNIDLRMRLAQALAVAGRANDAVGQYEAALKIKKDYLPALSGLGFIALQEQDWKTGESYYRKIVAKLAADTPVGAESTLETAYFYLGTALMEQKQYEEAVGYFKEALRLRRDASDTHYALAVCYREMGADDAYEDSLGNALLFDPKMPEANYYYALVLLEKKDVAAAAEHLRTAIDAAPGRKEPQEELAKLGSAASHLAKARELKDSDAAQALEQARIAIAVDPSSQPAQLLAAELYLTAGNKEEAKTIIDDVLVSDPKNKQALALQKEMADE